MANNDLYGVILRDYPYSILLKIYMPAPDNCT